MNKNPEFKIWILQWEERNIDLFIAYHEDFPKIDQQNFSLHSSYDLSHRQ